MKVNVHDEISVYAISATMTFGDNSKTKKNHRDIFEKKLK